MPQRIIMSVKAITATIGIIVGLFGAFQSYAVLPYQVIENKKLIEDQRLRQERDHDLLTQIAADIRYLKERSK
jgi:hypothetical protein